MQKKFFKTFFLLAIFSMLPNFAWAAPTVTSAIPATTFSNNAVVNITGSGFGTKSQAKPLVWASFDGGSTSPSNLGSITSWADDITAAPYGMQLTSNNCYAGAGCLQNFPGYEANGTAIGVQTNLLDRGQKYYLNFRRRDTYTPTDQNVKFLRFWPSGYGQPDFYASDGGGANVGWHRLYLESGDDVTSYTRFSLNWPVPNATWRNDEYLVQLNSAVGAHDGTFISSINSATTDSISDFQTDASSTPGVQSMIYFQDEVSVDLVAGQGPLQDGTVIQYDNIYLDSTWQHILICAGSAWNTRGNCEVQIPSAWNDSSATVTINQGNFFNGSTEYLYVVDASGTPSNPQTIVFGSSEISDTTPPAAPSGLSVQ